MHMHDLVNIDDTLLSSQSLPPPPTTPPPQSLQGMKYPNIQNSMEFVKLYMDLYSLKQTVLLYLKTFQVSTNS